MTVDHEQGEEFFVIIDEVLDEEDAAERCSNLAASSRYTTNTRYTHATGPASCAGHHRSHEVNGCRPHDDQEGRRCQPASGAICWSGCGYLFAIMQENHCTCPRHRSSKARLRRISKHANRGWPTRRCPPPAAATGSSTRMVGGEHRQEYDMRHILLPMLIGTFALSGCNLGGGGGGGDAPPAPVNSAPTVSIAPPGQGAVNEDVALTGNVTDDGLPGSGMVYTWTKISGPGTVTFANGSAAVTSARFSAVGSYTVRLEANDGALVTGANVTIDVIDPYVTIAGVQFDIRHSADPVFAATDAPQVDLYKNITSGGNTTRRHFTWTYAAETVSTVPCVRVHVVHRSDYLSGSPATLVNWYVRDHDFAVAKAVDGKAYFLRSHFAWTEMAGTANRSGDMDCTANLPVFLAKIDGTALPFTFPTVVAGEALPTMDPKTAATGIVHAQVADTPSARGAAYQVDISATAAWGLANPSVTPAVWLYLIPGKGIVDADDGWSLVAPAAN